MMEPLEMVKADPGYRRGVLTLYAGLVAAGFVAIKYLLPLLRLHYAGLAMMDLLVGLRTLFVVILASFMPAAAYVVHVGRKTLVYECYPYPGRKVMFDTEVVRGTKAQRRGRALVTLGTVCLILTALSMIYTYVRITGWINSPKLRRFYGAPSAFVAAPAAGLREWDADYADDTDHRGCILGVKGQGIHHEDHEERGVGTAS